MLKLFNTLTRKIEEFKPLNGKKVGMYICGPTVYDYTHIGHLKKYIGDDLLRRVLEANGFEVKMVMNITDVGHLTSDADEGDDKLEKRAKEKNTSVWELSKFFTDYFLKSTDAVNIERPNIIARATDHINEQIKLIERLEKKGFAYKTDQAVYFNTKKLLDYGKLTGQKAEEKVIGARDEVITDSQKKNPIDFALWFFTVGRFKNHIMKWPSPWGEGFPGWHIECSAMSMEYLGDTLDIHTGGEDHVAPHHTNEIAQSEAATDKPFSRFWVHHRFLIVNGEKMSKSKKNFYTIDDVEKKGFDPLAFRYLVLTSHYRDPLNFTWKSLEASQNALNNLRMIIREWSLLDVIARSEEARKQSITEDYYVKFMDAVNDDLGIPRALAIMWEMVKSNLDMAGKSATILEMDKILGLGLEDYLGKPQDFPEEVKKLVSEREKARKSGDFKKADELRKKIKSLDYEVEDTSKGSKIKEGV